jgi:hypothetical protein
VTRRSTEITLVLLGILLGALTNIATAELSNMLPSELFLSGRIISNG